MGNINRRITVQPSTGINSGPYIKNNQCKKGWRHESVGSCLPDKCKALISHLTTAKIIIILIKEITSLK
jgi:hypothetical protein